MLSLPAPIPHYLIEAIQEVVDSRENWPGALLALECCPPEIIKSIKARWPEFAKTLNPAEGSKSPIGFRLRISAVDGFLPAHLHIKLRKQLEGFQRELSQNQYEEIKEKYFGNENQTT